MKMTTKMLAVAMVAVMAFAAFAVVDTASDDDATYTNYAEANSYKVYVDDTQIGTSGTITTVSALANQYTFAVAGTLAFDDTDKDWAMKILITNSKWTSASISNILVNDVPVVLEGTGPYYIQYDLDVAWNEADNVFALKIVDNTHPDAVDYFTIDMTSVLLEKYEVDGTKYTDLKTALDVAVTADKPVEVLKTFEKSYNYGKNVDFGNGFILTAAGYDVEIVQTCGSETSVMTLVDVGDAPSTVYYKATSKAFETAYIQQPWNLTPIAIASIECTSAASVEYNGENQEPTLKVTDVNGTVLSGYNVTYAIGMTPTTKPLNVGTYNVSIDRDSFKNFVVAELYCTFTITPYDLSVPGRVSLEGDNGLVYDGTAKTVFIKFDEKTKALFAISGNEIEADDLYGVCEQMIGTTPTTVYDITDVSTMSVKGVVAGTHIIKMAVGDNFTSGIVGQANVNFEWTIAQGTISADKYTLKWSTESVLWANTDTVLMFGTPALVKDVDYKIIYVSVDGLRSVDKLEAGKTFGSWRAIAIGTVNYSGSVITEAFKVIDAQYPVYALTTMNFTEQGNSMIIGISPAIEPGKDGVLTAEMIITYNSVELIDGVYQYVIGQIAKPINAKTESVYVTLDGMYSYAKAVLKYTYGASSQTAMTIYSQPLVYTIDAKPWATSEVKIVDANYDYIDGAMLVINDNYIPNGAAIAGGLKDVTKLKVAYMGKEFDVSNYAIVNGKVNFDGKIFKVNAINAPTEYLVVSVPNGNKIVGETVQITVSDGANGDLISNFSAEVVTKVSVNGSESTAAAQFVTVDAINWTIKATVACKVDVTFTFQNQVRSISVQFGDGGAVANAIQYETVTTPVVDPVTSTSAFSASNTAVEGEFVKLTVTTDAAIVGTPLVVIKETLTGNTVVVDAGVLTGTNTYEYLFIMPATGVTVTVTAVKLVPAP